MTTLILAVAGLAVINFAFKAIGPALLGGRTLPPRGQSIVTASPSPARGPAAGRSGRRALVRHGPHRPAGLAAALGLRLRGWPHLACIAVAIATTIALRAVT